MGCLQFCCFNSGEKSDEELDQNYLSPQVVPRSQTDSACCLVFIVCLTCLFGITAGAFISGDLRRFEGLPDSAGQVCGVSQSVIDKPYLFFCLDPTQGVSLTTVQRQCVSSCPSEVGLSAPCGIAYPTKNYSGMLCMPSKAENIADLSKSFERHPTLKFIMEAAEIPKAWVPILCSGVQSIILGFLYLYFLRKCTCLVWVGLGMIVAVTGVMALYFAYAGITGGADHLPATGDSKTDWLVCLVLLLISAITTCTILFKRQSVEMAMNSIKAAAECITDTKSLLFEPFLALAIRGAIFVLLLIGLLLVYTCKTDKLTAGNIRFSYEEWQYYIQAYYIFMIIWIMELCNAMSQFVVSYAVEMWFFSSYNSQNNSKSHPGLACVACEAHSVAMKYHLGSLAFGSFIIAVFRSFQIVMGILTEAAQDTGNPVGACAGKVCICCIECFRRCIEHLNKTAYMDIALNGNAFCPAAYHAMSILTSNATAVGVLKGATWLFELAGLGGITAAGVGLTFWTIKLSSTYNDPLSANYIPEPILVCATAGLVSLLMALPFVIVFGQATDTVLFCFAIDEKRKKLQEAKPLMEKLQEGTSGWFSGVFGTSATPKGMEDVLNQASDQAMAHGPETKALLQLAVRNSS